eukprot:scaffold1867_cov247-Pinguiococcus_pyrenoidosus.AAC.29
MELGRGGGASGASKRVVALHACRAYGDDRVRPRVSWARSGLKGLGVSFVLKAGYASIEFADEASLRFSRPGQPPRAR